MSIPFFVILYSFLFIPFSSLSAVSVLVCCWGLLSFCLCAGLLFGSLWISKPNRILLVTIHHMLYPITVEVLHQIFSPHGFVEKIVTFQKSAGFQALIQYQLHQSAISARNSLQGRNIYDGCCQLDIQFSNLDELQVNYNNERSRDFTNPSLPSEQKGKSPQVNPFFSSIRTDILILSFRLFSD
ncbi:hypothetical protein ACS0TY_030857 [Phlomoides rotata]